MKIKAAFSGFDKVISSIKDTITGEKAIRQNLNQAALEMEKALRTSISKRYNISSQELAKYSLINPIKKDGKKYRKEITYNTSTTNAINFITKIAWGNLPTTVNPSRPGRVHYLTIKRNIEKISYGRYKQGGFSIIRNGKKILVERVTKSKYPLKQIYTLSPAEMAKSIAGTSEYINFQRQILLKYFL